MFTFKFEVTPEAQYRATREVNRRSKPKRIVQAVFVVLPFIMVALSIIQGRPLVESVLTTSPWFILMWGLVFFLLPWLQRRQIRTIHKTTPSLGGEQTFVFDPTGLHMSGALTNTNLKWDALTEVVETPEFFLFYLAKDFAYFLPEDAVRPEDAKEKFRAFVEGHLRGRTRWEGAS